MAAGQPATRLVGWLVLVAGAPPPAAAGRSSANDQKGNDERDKRGNQLQRMMSEMHGQQDRDRDEAKRQRPTLPTDRQARSITKALRREPFGAVAHTFSFGGRPRLRGTGDFSLTPRAPSASRSRHSTCALMLLSSAAAQRSTAAHSAGSTRSG